MRISNSPGGVGDDDSGMSGESMDNYMVNMSEWDFERKLRTAQKITISKEILDLDKDGPNLLPEILFNRIARPCSALVLWQPPPVIGCLIADKEGENLERNDQDKNTINTDTVPATAITQQELTAGVDDMET